MSQLWQARLTCVTSGPKVSPTPLASLACSPSAATGSDHSTSAAITELPRPVHSTTARQQHRSQHDSSSLHSTTAAAFTARQQRRSQRGSGGVHSTLPSTLRMRQRRHSAPQHGSSINALSTAHPPAHQHHNTAARGINASSTPAPRYHSARQQDSKTAPPQQPSTAQHWIRGRSTQPDTQHADSTAAQHDSTTA